MLISRPPVGSWSSSRHCRHHHSSTNMELKTWQLCKIMNSLSLQLVLLVSVQTRVRCTVGFQGLLYNYLGAQNLLIFYWGEQRVGLAAERWPSLMCCAWSHGHGLKPTPTLLPRRAGLHWPHHLHIFIFPVPLVPFLSPNTELKSSSCWQYHAFFWFCIHQIVSFKKEAIIPLLYFVFLGNWDLASDR